MKHIAVVGGGISGIAAALTLIQSGKLRVTLLESSPRLGGVLETIRPDGYLIERSADNFATLIPDARDLSEQWGLLPQLIHPNPQGRRAFVLVNGRIHPIPAGFSLMQPTRLGSILTSRTLSWPGKLRLLSEICVAPRRLASDAATDDESLESFAVRRLGREAFDKLVEPIVSGIFTADPRTLSMAATMPQFLQMERTSGGLIRGFLAARRQDAAAAARRASGARYDQFLAPRDGMSSWIEGLARHLPTDCVRLGAAVDELNLVEAPAGAAPQWQLLSAGQRQTFDGVVLATPAAVTARLLATVAPTAAQIVRDVPYASSVVVAMVINRADLPARLDGFGLVVPSRERRAALAISYSSNKYPGRVPDDQILLRIFLGGALRPEVIDQSDAWLEQTAHAELRDLLGWRASKPRWQAVIRWREAMPQYLVGHVARMQQLQRELASLPTLGLCGAAYHGVGIPQCVRSARQAASQLLSSLAE